MRVFVLLPADVDVEVWRRGYREGAAPDATPYGYHHAAEAGCDIRFSRPTAPGHGLRRRFRRLLNHVLGFDIVHAFNNRDALAPENCDVIWTHTENEHLAVRLLQWLGRLSPAPMISQSVWLMDDWPRVSPLHRWLYRRLLAYSEVLTFLSPSNAEAARRQNFGVPLEMVRFGVSAETFAMGPPRQPIAGAPLRILALGNDRHRDWETLAAAFGDQPAVEVRIGSRTYPRHLVHANIDVREHDLPALLASYAWADLVVLPLRPNLHASGLTVLLEAVSMGVPVLASDTGGLSAYFSDDEVTFVPGGDPEQLRQAAMSLGPSTRTAKAILAQKRLLDADYTSRGFALRHAAISRWLLENVRQGRQGDRMVGVTGIEPVTPAV